MPSGGKPLETLDELAAEMDRLSMPCPATGCYLWLGQLRDGQRSYGRIHFRGAKRGAHRIAYELRHGPIEVGLFICHRCDVPECVNPDHLFAALHSDNMADAVEKGRHARRRRVAVTARRGGGRRRPPVIRGTDHVGARLDEAKVREIRASTAAASVFAIKYGVAKATINKIRRRVAWAHVE